MNLVKKLCSLGTQGKLDPETTIRIITVNAIALLTAVFAIVIAMTLTDTFRNIV